MDVIQCHLCFAERAALQQWPAVVQRRQGRNAAMGPRAASKVYEGGLVGTGMRFAVVVGRFNDLVTKLLLEGAKGTFERHGVRADDVDVSTCVH